MQTTSTNIMRTADNSWHRLHRAQNSRQLLHHFNQSTNAPSQQTMCIYRFIAYHNPQVVNHQQLLQRKWLEGSTVIHGNV